MASYRPFPPQCFPPAPPPPPNQNPLPPQQHYDQNYNQMNLKPNYHYPPSRPPPQQQQQPPPPQQKYSYPSPPPPPDSSYPPPACPPLPTMSQNTFNSQPPMYYPPSQYSSQYSNTAMQPPPPPPPPSSPGSSIPPPPSPSSPPPPPPKESAGDTRLTERGKGGNRDFSGSGRLEHGHSNQGIGSWFTKYTIISLEKMYKPKLFVEPDLGIPLDLLDLSVYNRPSVRQPLAPEDEELLGDDVTLTPVKKDGIRRKERPTEKGVSWLVKTQYISPLSMESTKLSLTENQAKELRELKGGRNLLENLNNRERQIKEIESSFEASKLRPVHATNKNLEPIEVIPLLPDFDRYGIIQGCLLCFYSPFWSLIHAENIDYIELEISIVVIAIMKSYVAPSSDLANPEKFLAYMVPSVGELSKDMYDELEDISYSWVREYHWDVRGDDANDPTTYLVSFDEGEAHYVPLPTKLNLRKKRAREGRTGDEIEHFPMPSRITARRRSTVAAIELKEPEAYSNMRDGILCWKIGRLDAEDGLGRPRKLSRHQDVDQYSGGEDDFSE
ncbi:protein PAF1 homolog [Hibiscus syriacus]|uniref:protein PAF1 homolog n=1 Tax=Hibiscus syriacus TaxID=106335 RepID=UPI0019203FD9|nr:protein PAF1 homolog [Hibiscus syriacus]